MSLPSLLPCPFCGEVPDPSDRDCLYPVGKQMDEYGNFTTWGLHCSESVGGCSAQILGDSKEDCIIKWNTRVEYRV